MQFLNPLFWIAAATVAIPIALHLTRRESSQRLRFASLMFFRHIQVADRQRQRLQHLPLLLLRCLGLLLLIGAFAQPTIPPGWAGTATPLAARSVLILLDRSLSVSGSSRWEAALDAAEERISALTRADEGLIVQFADSSEILSGWERDRAELRRTLHTRVSPSFEGTSYTEALRTAVDQFKSAHNPDREIYLITDLQSTGLSAGSDWRVPSNIHLEIRDVGSEAGNLFVEDVGIEREVFARLYPYPPEVGIRSSPASAVSGEAELWLNDTLVATRGFQTDSRGTARLTFDRFEVNDGIQRGRVVLKPSDAIPTDNTYHFVVEKKAPAQVLILTSMSRESSSFYLESALESDRTGRFQIEKPSGAVPAIDPMKVPLVIMDDLSAAPPASLLRQYLENGGNVILVLGGNTRAETYHGEWSGLLPAELIERYYARSQRKPFTSITSAQWHHPALAVFRDLQKSLLAEVEFYGYWRVRANPGTAVLASFDEGDPALLESRVGTGKMLMLTSSLDSSWTDFPLHPAYVPFLNRLIDYVTQLQVRPSSSRVGALLPLSKDLPPGWNVIDPAGRRVLELGKQAPEYLKLDLPGYYEVRANRTTDWVAVNGSPLESKLDRVSREEFLKSFLSDEVASTDESPPEAEAEEKPGLSIWWLALLAAAVVLIAEALLANRTRARR